MRLERDKSPEAAHSGRAGPAAKAPIQRSPTNTGGLRRRALVMASVHRFICTLSCNFSMSKNERWPTGHAEALVADDIHPNMIRPQVATHGPSVQTKASLVFTEWLDEFRLRRRLVKRRSRLITGDDTAYSAGSSPSSVS